MTTQINSQSGPEEFLTIIAPTLSDVMQQYKSRGLSAAGYAITGQAGRHQFSMAGPAGSTELFDGTPMVAATFRRTCA